MRFILIPTSCKKRERNAMNQKTSLPRNLLCLLLALTALLAALVPAMAADGFRYRHDPRLNPKAMADVTADASAVYGFRPNETGSLKQYADLDWSDPEMVAQGRADRIAYHESLEEMYVILEELQAEGADIETIARTLSAKRNELRLAACANEDELARTKARNLEKYGHEEGPLPDELFETYGSWETVLSKAFTANSGMDACLGLYDDYYTLYLASGQIPPESADPARRQYVVAAVMDALAPAAAGQSASLSDFFDVDAADAWFLPEWEQAVTLGLLRGYEDRTLRPQSVMPRVEALVFLSRCLPNLEPAGEPIAFTDVPDWAKADIDRLSAAGIVRGCGDGRLGADDPITVEQVSALLARVQGETN